MKFILKRCWERKIEDSQLLKEFDLVEEETDGGFVYHIELADIKQLLTLKKSCGSTLIISEDLITKENKLIIYDDYIE